MRKKVLAVKYSYCYHATDTTVAMIETTVPAQPAASPGLNTAQPPPPKPEPCTRSATPLHYPKPGVGNFQPPGLTGMVRAEAVSEDKPEPISVL